MLQELLQWLLGIAGGGAVLGYLGRTVADHVFSKDLARFRARLAQDADAELEKLRAGLERELYEHKKRFGWIYQREVETLASLAEKVIEASGATRRAAQAALVVDRLGPGSQPLLDEALPRSVKAYTDADAAFRTRRIFLSEQTAVEAISTFLDELGRLQRQVEFLNLTVNQEVKPTLGKHRETAVDGISEYLEGLDEAEEELVQVLRQVFGQMGGK